MISGSVGLTRFNATGEGAASMTGWEGETLVKVELHVFRGHRLDIEDRLRISDDKNLLLYSQQIRGPRGKEGRFEIEFDIVPE
jgi:hypothetical protein